MPQMYELTVDSLLVATKKVLKTLDWDSPYVIYLEIFRKLLKECLVRRRVFPQQLQVGQFPQYHRGRIK